MECKCFKCKNTIGNDDFICPHCGAILGDPICYAATVKKDGSKKHSSFRWIVAAILIIALIGAACVIGWRLRSQSETTAPTSPAATTTPVPPQTTAPLTVYTAHVITVNKTDLTGTMVHVYLGEQLLYTGELDESGDVTFILPESQGYSIRLSALPVQYQIHYGDAEFPFVEDARHLQVTLEEKPVPYTVRIVNRAGEPMPGTGIMFYSSGEEPQQQVTDESGCCTFMANYGMSSCLAYVVFAPNGYIPGTGTGFGYNTLETEIELWTYEESGFSSESIRTVRVVDENGEPVSDISLALSGSDPDADGPTGMYYSGVTNLEGCFCFAGGDNLQWEVKILKNADYHDTVFRFEEVSKELLIQLDLHKDPGTKYTYTVTFMDYSDVPIADVKIAYQPPDSDKVQFYTSDENGIITFQTTVSDPSNVKYRISSVPDGYYTNRPDDALYGFLPYERRTFVRLHYDGHVDYTVFVMDDSGAGVQNVYVFLWEDGKRTGLVQTDHSGMAAFRTEPGTVYEFTIDCQSEPYTNYVIDKIERFGERIAYITIAPPTDEP